jgi:hypothetical protein
MNDDPTNDNNTLGDGTPASLEAFRRDGVLSVSDDDEVLALELAEDLAAHDAALIAREGPDALTSDRAARLSQFRAVQAIERDAAIRQAERHPDRVGYVLATFRMQQDWSREQLADWLGVSADDFGRLAIEIRPRAVDGLTLLYDPEPINEVADRHGAHRERLYEAFACRDE